MTASDEKPTEKRSKGTAPPMCKVCQTRHWGTCANQTSGGYLSNVQAAPKAVRVQALKAAVAKAAAIPAKKPKKARKRP